MTVSALSPDISLKTFFLFLGEITSLILFEMEPKLLSSTVIYKIIYTPINFFFSASTTVRKEVKLINSQIYLNMKQKEIT